MTNYPVALIASVSSRDREALRTSVERSGFASFLVNDAEAAALQLATREVSVLVIDSGLLEAPHDPQWRRLRAHHPEVGVVIRCLIPQEHSGVRTDASTILVHPADAEGVPRAVHVLACTRRSNADPPPRRTAVAG